MPDVDIAQCSIGYPLPLAKLSLKIVNQTREPAMIAKAHRYHLSQTRLFNELR